MVRLMAISIAFLCFNSDIFGQYSQVEYGFNATQFITDFVSPNDEENPLSAMGMTVHFYFVQDDKAIRLELGVASPREVDNISVNDNLVILFDTRFAWGMEKRIRLPQNFMFLYGGGIRLANRQVAADFGPEPEFRMSHGGNVFTGIQYDITDRMSVRTEAGFTARFDIFGNGDITGDLPIPDIDGVRFATTSDLLNAVVFVIRF